MKSKILTLLVCLALLSCKEDDPKPTGAEKQGVLLAGKKGQSKTWLLTDYSIAGSTVEDFVCFENSEYTFTNNAAQEFEGDEGDEINCTDGEGAPLPQFIESGNWAFSVDGNKVIISSDIVESNVAIFSYFTNLGTPFPADVITLTSDEFVIEVTYTTPVFSETARLTFELK